MDKLSQQDLGLDELAGGSWFPENGFTWKTRAQLGEEPGGSDRPPEEWMLVPKGARWPSAKQQVGYRFASRRSLLQDFDALAKHVSTADLHQARALILPFANKYGLLRLAQVWFFPDPVSPTAPAVKAEALGVWLEACRLFNRARRIQQLLPSVVKGVERDRRELEEILELPKHTLVSRILDLARDRVKTELDPVLRDYTGVMQIGVLPKFGIHYTPGNLLGAIFFLLAYDLAARGSGLRACRHCGRLFIPTRPDQIYHPGGNCARLAYRERERVKARG